MEEEGEGGKISESDIWHYVEGGAKVGGAYRCSVVEEEGEGGKISKVMFGIM